MLLSWIVYIIISFVYTYWAYIYYIPIFKENIFIWPYQSDWEL